MDAAMTPATEPARRDVPATPHPSSACEIPALVRVISLAGHRARRDRFARAAEDAPLLWSFFDAHEASSLAVSPGRSRLSPHYGRSLTASEIGCFSSHVAVWRAFLGSAARLLFVFEDDTVVDWDYVGFLSRVDFAGMGLDYVRLFNKTPVKQVPFVSPFLSKYHHLTWNLQRPLGTQAYLLTRKGAEILVRHCAVIRRPIDQEMDRAWSHGLPSLTLHPSPVFERFAESTIGETRFAIPDAHRMASVAFLVEGLRKRLFNAQPSRARHRRRISLDQAHV